MRRSATSFMAIAALSVELGQAALAADLPARPEYKVPVVAAPVTQWTGCYIGGSIGAGWSRGEISNGQGADAISETGTGITAGGQFGCDYQAGAMVFGIRNQTNWADLKSSVWIGSGNFNGYTSGVTNNWFDLLTARVGYALQPSWLLYIQGGAAWRNFDQKLIDVTGIQVGRVNNTRTGWTIGVGSEYMVTRKWSVFLEYKYANFGPDSTNIFAPGITPPFTGSVRANAQTITGGVNFSF